MCRLLGKRVPSPESLGSPARFWISSLTSVVYPDRFFSGTGTRLQLKPFYHIDVLRNHQYDPAQTVMESALIRSRFEARLRLAREQEYGRGQPAGAPRIVLPLSKALCDSSSPATAVAPLSTPTSTSMSAAARRHQHAAERSLARKWAATATLVCLTMLFADRIRHSLRRTQRAALFAIAAVVVATAGRAWLSWHAATVRRCRIAAISAPTVPPGAHIYLPTSIAAADHHGVSPRDRLLPLRDYLEPDVVTGRLSVAWVAVPPAPAGSSPLTEIDAETLLRAVHTVGGISMREFGPSISVTRLLMLPAAPTVASAAPSCVLGREFASYLCEQAPALLLLCLHRCFALDADGRATFNAHGVSVVVCLDESGEALISMSSKLARPRAVKASASRSSMDDSPRQGPETCFSVPRTFAASMFLSVAGRRTPPACSTPAPPPTIPPRGTAPPQQQRSPLPGITDTAAVSIFSGGDTVVFPTPCSMALIVG
jgi:hypothetical protein